MAQLHCSNALLTQLDAVPGRGATPESAPGRLGDWCVSLFPIESRKALLFMNQSTLLSFIVLEGRRFDADLFARVFLGGLSQTLVMEGYPAPKIREVVDSYSELILAKASSTSHTALIKGLARDYEHLVLVAGGLKHCDIGIAIHQLNHRPRKSLNFAAPQEVTREVLSAQSA